MCILPSLMKCPQTCIGLPPARKATDISTLQLLQSQQASSGPYSSLPCNLSFFGKSLFCGFSHTLQRQLTIQSKVSKNQAPIPFLSVNGSVKAPLVLTCRESSHFISRALAACYKGVSHTAPLWGFLLLFLVFCFFYFSKIKIILD